MSRSALTLCVICQATLGARDQRTFGQKRRFPRRKQNMFVGDLIYQTGIRILLQNHQTRNVFAVC